MAKPPRDPQAAESLQPDVAWSLVRRRGDRIEISLAMPATLAAGETSIRLTQGEKSVSAQATVAPGEHGPMLTAQLPATRLPRGRWRVFLGDGTRVAARIVSHPGQPIALLIGTAPKPGRSRPTPRHSVLGDALKGGRRGGRFVLDHVPGTRAAYRRAKGLIG